MYDDGNSYDVRFEFGRDEGFRRWKIFGLNENKHCGERTNRRPISMQQANHCLIISNVAAPQTEWIKKNIENCLRFKLLNIISSCFGHLIVWLRCWRWPNNFRRFFIPSAILHECENFTDKSKLVCFDNIISDDKSNEMVNKNLPKRSSTSNKSQQVIEVWVKQQEEHRKTAHKNEEMNKRKRTKREECHERVI